MKHTPSVRKILQVLYHIQNKAPSDNSDRFDILYLLKIIFFSDRYHVRHFGITATYDDYYAMKNGPVASTALDVLMKNVFHLTSSEVGYLSAVKKLDEYKAKIDPQEEDELSESVIEAIGFALKEFGKYGWGELSNISHCYPEWKKHEKSLSSINKRIPMDLRDFFDDPDHEGKTLLSEYGKSEDPFKDDKEFLTLMREDAFPI
jgi:hypothetical protein